MATGRVEGISRSPEQTQQIGKALGANARSGQVFLLIGDLGAGKTCLTQGVLQGLGGSEQARSPSFVLVSQYEGRLPLYHIDLYRLGSAEEVLDLGLDEYLDGQGVCVVEWADRALDLLTRDHLEVRIKHLDEKTRHLTLSAESDGYADILDAARSSVSQE